LSDFVLFKFDEALGLLYEAKRDQPKEVSIYANLAELFFQRSLPEEAIKVSHQALALEPQHSQVNFWIGRHFCQTAQPGKAESHLIVATKELPPPIPFHIKKEMADQLTEPPSYASEAHQLLASIFEAKGMCRSIAVTCNVTPAILSTGQYQDATRHYQTASEYAPEDYQLQMKMSQLYQATNEPQKAEQALRKAAVINPSEPLPNLMLADKMMNEKRYELAITYYDKVLHLTIDAETKTRVYSKLSQCFGELAKLDNDPRKAAQAAEFARLAKP